MDYLGVCFAVILGSVFNLFKHLKIFILQVLEMVETLPIRNGKSTS